MEKIVIDMDQNTGGILVNGHGLGSDKSYNSDIKDCLPEGDTLLGFLRGAGLDEVIDESVDPKIPEKAAIRLAEIAAKELGGVKEDYINMNPRDLRDIAIEYNRKHQKEPIMPISKEEAQAIFEEKLKEEGDPVENLKKDVRDNVINSISGSMPGY